jgi:hypothetical protein
MRIAVHGSLLAPARADIANSCHFLAPVIEARGGPERRDAFSSQ